MPCNTFRTSTSNFWQRWEFRPSPLPGISGRGKKKRGAEKFRSQFDRPIATIVVATSKPEKDWLPGRWAAVADLLADKYGLQPVLVGGTSTRELAAADAITAAAKSKPFSALGSGLRNLVGILDSSELVLSPDTGPLHMTIALDKPVISLMGYTDPRRTGPYRKFHDLIIDAFHDAGEQGPVTMKTRHGRMPRISVEDVAARIELWNERYRPKS
jgi:ADP-heptose:LPS heptosyltransferase